jgi:hypothetical protein
LYCIVLYCPYLKLNGILSCYVPLTSYRTNLIKRFVPMQISILMEFPLLCFHWWIIILYVSVLDACDFKNFDFYLSHFIHAFCLFTSIYNVLLNYLAFPLFHYDQHTWLRQFQKCVVCTKWDSCFSLLRQISHEGYYVMIWLIVRICMFIKDWKFIYSELLILKRKSMENWAGSWHKLYSMQPAKSVRQLGVGDFPVLHFCWC